MLLVLVLLRVVVCVWVLVLVCRRLEAEPEVEKVPLDTVQ